MHCDETADGIAFWIHVTPRARRPGVGGVHGGALRVAVSAPPARGKANAACAAALARALDVPRRAVTVPPTSRGRRKRVEVRTENPREAASLQARVLALAAASWVG